LTERGLRKGEGGVLTGTSKNWDIYPSRHGGNEILSINRGQVSGGGQEMQTLVGLLLGRGQGVNSITNGTTLNQGSVYSKKLELKIAHSVETELSKENSQRPER